MSGGFGRDLRYAARTLLKSRSFSVVAVLALALGISGNTVMYSALQNIVLRPLPFYRPERLVMIWETELGQGMTDSVVPSNFLDWRAQSRSFEQLAGFFPYLRLNLGGVDRPEELLATSATGNFFSTLGARAALGRTFTSQDDKVVVLSHVLWSRLFGSDRGVVGRPIKLSDELFTIVGVMPPSFHFPPEAELWVRAPQDVPQMRFDESMERLLRLRFIRVVGRLAPGVTLEQARSEMAGISRRLETVRPDRNAGRGVNLVPLHEQVVGQVRPILLLLMGAVGLVLLIACTNVANLLFARASSRHREMAIRIAMGAGRGSLIRQLLVESMVLSLVAGALGLLLARWELSLLLQLVPEEVPRLGEIALDGGVLAFTLGVSLLTGILFGLLPALQITRPDLVGALKEGSKGTPGLHRRRVQSALLVWEVAITLVLLVGTGLLLKSFLQLQQADPGFRQQGLLTFKVSLPASRYPEQPQMGAFFTRLVERLRMVPGVEGVAASITLPMPDNNITRSFAIAGRPLPPPEEQREEGLEIVSPGYFEVLGVPLRRGRYFASQDAFGGTGVVIVSESVARRYWGGADPIGQRISYDDPTDPEAEWFTVIGVVADIHNFGLEHAERPTVYAPFTQNPWPFMNLILRTRVEPMSVLPAVRRAVTELDPEQPIADVLSMEQLVDQASAWPRLTLVLVSLFAVLATLLAAIGMYGVTAYAVVQTRHEIGLRMALGAGRGDILGRVVRQGLLLTGIGIALGLAAALALTRIIRSMLFEVSSTDALTYVGVAALLVAVSLLASSIPAYRASRVEPAVVIKEE